MVPRCLVFVCAGVACLTGPVRAEDEPDPDNLYEANAWYPSLNYQGSVGLVDMPTARMLPDGNLALAGSGKEPDQRLALLFQITPWLEGAFRYAHINGFTVDQPNFYDRSFSIKLRLLTESKYRPAVAVGLNDILGTGVYGGEYIVASKRFGDFDASVGIGWGRYGSSGTFGNPLTNVDDSFATRDTRTIEDTGQFNLGSYFSGPDMGIFGGIEYSPPWKPLDGLKLQLEYSSDRYVQERAAQLIRYNVRSPINVGATYEALDGLEVGAHYLYGNTFGIRFALKADPRKRLKLPRFDRKPDPFRVRPEEERRPEGAEEVTPDRFDRLRNSILERPTSSARAVIAGDLPVDLALTNRVSPARPADTGRAGPKRALWLARSKPEILTPLQVSERYLSDQLRLNPVTDLCLDGRSAVEDCAQGRAERVRMERARIQLASAEGGNRLVERMAQAQMIAAGGRKVAVGGNPAEGLSDTETYERIRQEAGRFYMDVLGIARRDKILRVFFATRRYDRIAEAIGRMTRILTQLAPNDIEVFELEVSSGDLPVTQVTVPRAELERILIGGGSPDEILAAVKLESAPRSYAQADWRPDRHPRFGYGIAPGFRQSVFDPDDPYRYQFLIRLNLDIALARGLSVNTVGAINLFNNFDEIERVSDSTLPRVRSDFARFLQDGENGIDSMALNYRFKLDREVYGRIAAGYVEEMFGGVGGEVLYRPHGKRWALGANVYGVRQRDFNKLFDFQDYQTVTGHGSFYYELPFHDLNLAIHAGRYLAGDYGATIDLRRRFDTGVEIGAFATFTNVPFEEFGEGSFDKGLIIRIPFGWFTPYSTRRTYNVDLRPLTRDGGQRILGSTDLYYQTQRESLKEIERNWDGFDD